MGISTPTIIMTISWDIAHQQCVAGLSQNARYIYMPISMRRLMRNHGVLGYPILRQAQMMLLKTVFNPVWGEVLLYTFGKRLVSMSLDLGNPSPWNDCSRFFRSWWQPLKSLATILGSNDQKRSQFGSLGSLGVIFRQFVFYLFLLRNLPDRDFGSMTTLRRSEFSSTVGVCDHGTVTGNWAVPKSNLLFPTCQERASRS